MLYGTALGSSSNCRPGDSFVSEAALCGATAPRYRAFIRRFRSFVAWPRILRESCKADSLLPGCHPTLRNTLSVGRHLQDRTGDNNRKLFWIAIGMKKGRKVQDGVMKPGAGLPSMYVRPSIPCFLSLLTIIPTI